MMKTFSLILFSILLFFLNAQEEELVLNTKNCNLKGTLTLPVISKKQEKIPLVILIAGSGPTDRNCNQPGMSTNAFKYFADSLQTNGLACFRFDKRGIAASTSTESEKEMNFNIFIEDVKSWVNLLAKDKRFSKIIIAGHSEGSLIGMIAANKNKKISAYISIAGPGRPADEILKEQLSTQAEEAKKVMYAYLDKLKKGDTIGTVPLYYFALFRPNIQPYLISWFKYDPQFELKKLKIPILIVQGATDIQVSVADAELLSKANPKAKLIVIKNMNHVLKDCESIDKLKNLEIYKNKDLPLNKEFVKETISFIRSI